jgi:hypothetical protein
MASNANAPTAKANSPTREATSSFSEEILDDKRSCGSCGAQRYAKTRRTSVRITTKARAEKPPRLSDGTIPTPVLKSQVECLVDRLSSAMGALAFLTLCWECRPKGPTGQCVWRQRIGESFVAILAVQNPGGHRFESPDLNQAGRAGEYQIGEHM